VQPTCAGQSCCAVGHVPGGTFNRYNDPKYPATVSPLDLDLFEVTVARMRPFIEAVEGGWRPSLGSGASPFVSGSGWREEWTELAMFDVLRDVMAPVFEHGPPDERTKLTTWTSEPGANEAMPTASELWAQAQAFCIWDGGRLPTIAEWRFAAAGGDEQRPYPWGGAPATPDRAVLNRSGIGGPPAPDFYTDVGSVPGGAGRWGHMDLEGSRTEWVMDGAPTGTEPWQWPAPLLPCSDCMRVPLEDAPMALGTSSESHAAVANEMEDYVGFSKTMVDPLIGFRCVHGSTVVETP
jgi:formylglycine-generating enzyme required for sulfatase activity